MKTRSPQHLVGIAHKIAVVMYRESEPTADFDFLLKTYKDTEKETAFRYDYFLRGSRQLGIIETQCKTEKCNRYEKLLVTQIINQSFAPSTDPNKVKVGEEVKKGVIQHG